MAVSLKDGGIMDRLAYYIHGQAPNPVDYLLQGVLTTFLGEIPGLPGIAARAVAYRLILQARGFPAIECGVRLRHARNLRLGAGVFIDQGVYLHALPGGIEIGDDCCLMHNAELHVFNYRDLPHAFIRIGKGSFIGESVVIRGQGGVTIGDQVLLAPMAKVLAVNHNFGDPRLPVIEQGISGRGIVIEDGSWIGAGAVILDGVTVGRGAVVGANAVVTRDVPARTLVVGVPAAVIRELGNGPSSDRPEMGQALSQSGFRRTLTRGGRSFGA